MVNYKVDIDERFEELFKIKTYDKKCNLTSIQYGDNYFSELLLDFEASNDKRNKKELPITIKEVK